MTSPSAYPAIDRFRLVAALLIVAIHTSPLASYSATADFLLTRDLARVAVPFFFMVTGYFVLPKNAHALLHFEKRTVLLYALVILLYLPVNMYMRSFQSMGAFLQQLLVDGTLYHLWYLPAVLSGVLISKGLYHVFNLRAALTIALVLYLIGLGGDSYYGLLVQWPAAEQFYALLFHFCSYTRNGLFFAPIFMLLGTALAMHPPHCTARQLWLGLTLSAALMTGEVLLLRALAWPRHDSMTLFLLPTMFFLFALLLRPRGARLSLAADTAMLVYILHPLMILVVRFTARLTHTQMLFIDNTLLHFSAVSLLSFSCAFMLSAFKHSLEGKS